MVKKIVSDTPITVEDIIGSEKPKEEIKEEKLPQKETLKEETDVAKTKIEDLKLSNRTQNVLLKNRIKTAAGLLRLSEDELLNLEELGGKALKEIKKALGKLGFTLKQKD